MRKDTDFSIVFLPEFLIPSLEELNINMCDFNDAIKNLKVTSDLDVKNDEEYKVIVDKLIKFIGRSDLTELSLLNRYMHNVLQLEFYQNNFTMFFNKEILQGSGSYKSEENSICLILKTLSLSEHYGREKEFKDTFKVINNNNVVSIILKSGFTNFLVGSESTKVRYTLLKEIIDSVNSETIICNSIGVSFAKLTGVCDKNIIKL